MFKQPEEEGREEIRIGDKQLFSLKEISREE